MARKPRNLRGIGYIEVLVSTLILALSILAALSLYGFSMSMIDKTGNEGVAYNLVRQTAESAREAGFTSLVDGTTTTYYDSLGLNPSASKVPGSRFKVVEFVQTSSFQVVNGVTKPADDSIRTVTIKAYLASTNEQLDQTGSMFVRSGV